MDDKKTTPAWWQPALNVFAEVTGWIAVPVIGSLYLGRYLDNKYGTDPWFFLGLTAVAFLVSSIGIVKAAFKYIKQIEEESKKHEEINDRNSRDNSSN